MNKLNLITLSVIVLCNLSISKASDNYSNAANIDIINKPLLMNNISDNLSVTSANTSNIITTADYGDNATEDNKKEHKFTGNLFKDLKGETKEIYSVDKASDNNTALSNVKIISDEKAMELMSEFVEKYSGKKAIIANNSNEINEILRKGISKNEFIFDKESFDNALSKAVSNNKALRALLSSNLNYKILQNLCIIKNINNKDNKVFKIIENKLFECEFNKDTWNKLLKLFNTAYEIMNNTLQYSAMDSNNNIKLKEDNIKKNKILNENKNVNKIKPDIVIDTEDPTTFEIYTPKNKQKKKNYYDTFNNIKLDDANIKILKNNISSMNNKEKQDFINDMSYSFKKNKKLFNNKNIKINNQEIDNYFNNNNKLDTNKQVFEPLRGPNLFDICTTFTQNNTLFPIIMFNHFLQSMQFINNIIANIDNSNTKVIKKTPNTVIINEKTPNSEKNVLISFSNNNNGSLFKAISSTVTQQNDSEIIKNMFMPTTSIFAKDWNIMNSIDKFFSKSLFSTLF